MTKKTTNKLGANATIKFTQDKFHTKDEAQTAWLAFEFTAPEMKTEKKEERKPIDLALVIDRSGSMSGKPLEYAKLAAETVISMLGPKDRVSIYIYDHEVEKIASFTDSTKKSLAALRTVSARGSTNLSEGCYRAANDLSKTKGDRLRYLFLLSDGHANMGDMSADTIVSRIAKDSPGIALATFGLGHGYNEDLMEALALSLGGGYHYIENPEDAPAAFQTELDTVFKVTAEGVKLILTPQGDLKRSKEEVVLGWDRLEGKSIVFGDIPGGVKRQAYIPFTIPAGSKVGDKFQVGVALSANYEGQKKTQVERDILVIECVSEKTKVAEVDKAIMSEIERLQVLRLQKQATVFADAGDYSSAHRLMAGASSQVADMIAMYGDTEELLDLNQIVAQSESTFASPQSYNSATAKSLKLSNFRARRSVSEDDKS